jgi:hypothetical protein
MARATHGLLFSEADIGFVCACQLPLKLYTMTHKCGDVLRVAVSDQHARIAKISWRISYGGR